jgi:hypothetical protein
MSLQDCKDSNGIGKPGKLSKIITSEEISAVIRLYKEYPFGAVVLETKLDNRHSIKRFLIINTQNIERS